MTTFRDFGLNPMILQALTEIGFEEPTPVQSKIIPHLVNSTNDLIALAQTGTGKTAALALPIIQQLDAEVDYVQSLILCPTRELALQVASDIESYTRYLSDIRVVAVYGGEAVDRQIRALKKRPQIVVGTPGRVNDMIRRRLLKVDAVRWLVLDEADEMLNMGFKEELDDILKTMPGRKQVLLFSATMNDMVRRIADNYMKNPEDITVGNKNKGAENVQHFFYMVHEKDRYQALRRIADVNPDIHAIVFCRTRRETQQVADKLIADHYCAEAIHGEISQEQRTSVMNRFKEKKIQLLVATDVAARGIDVSGLTHVINYTLPESMEGYLHRSGRTGRANNLGISLVILNMHERHKVRALERKIGKPFEQGRVPSGEDVCEKQLFNLVENVCNVDVNEGRIGKYLDFISKKFENMSREDLIKKFVSVEFNRFLEYYQGATDLNPGANQKKFGRERASGREDSSVLFARFNINIGRRVGLNVKDLLRFLNDQPELRSVAIGNIELRNDCTLFEVDERLREQVLDCFNGKDMNGVVVRIVCEGTGLKSSRDFSRSRGRGSIRGDEVRRGSERSSGYSRENSGGESGGRYPRNSSGRGRDRRKRF